MRLNEWQRELEAYLLGADATPNPTLRASLLGSAALGAEQGLAIYHSAYRARLCGALRGDYPAVHGWLGNEEFDALASAYIDAHPSQHFSLRRLGAELACFIDDYLVPEQARPLGELARLEWAFTLAFDAPAGTPLSLAQIAELPAADWPVLQLRCVPSLQWQACRFNTLDIWKALKKQEEFPGSEMLAQENVCLIWREGLVCRYRSLCRSEAAALRGMVHVGWSFAELCAHLSEYGDHALLQAANWVRQWLSDGLVQRFYPAC